MNTVTDTTVIDAVATKFDGEWFAEVILHNGQRMSFRHPAGSRSTARHIADSKVGLQVDDFYDCGNWVYVD